MSLFLQLDSAAIPQGAPSFGKGLFQFFYCKDCYEDVAAPWEPYSEGHVFRVVPAKLEPPHAPSRSSRALKKNEIHAWEPFDDFPHPEDWEKQGLQFRFDSKGKSQTILCPELNLRIENLPSPAYDEKGRDITEFLNRCFARDKLGGWPWWLQGAARPNCNRCDLPMESIFQFDSEDHLDYMFGDAGCGHIFQCPKHQNVFAFTWECC